MDHARRTVLSHGLRRVRDWPLWALPRTLRTFILIAILGYLAWLGVAAAWFRFGTEDFLLFAALLACVAATVELTRRSSEPTGVIRDVYAVWELPIVILLPLLYALIIPAIRMALTQWRVRRAPLYRRSFSASAVGIGYGCASLVYHGILPVGCHPRAYLFVHPTTWLLASGVAFLAQWIVNQSLIMTAVKTADPATRIKDAVFGRESLHNDATELCAALLVALGMTISDLTLIIALPLVTVLQRSFRHTQLLNEARADAKTGLLNAAAWEREATAEVERAVRTGSPLAVALLDLDRFKHINDTYGHLLGDEVLRQIAATMTEILRDYDLAGRFGGEEFVMLLPQTRAVDAFRIAERVRAHIAQLPIYAGGEGSDRVPVSASIGVAALDAGSRRELTELIAAADAALYRAKASGRDQVQMISTSRGLSAVRPPGDDEVLSAGHGLFTGGALAPGEMLTATSPPSGADEGVLASDGALAAGGLASTAAIPEVDVPLDAGLNGAGTQLPAEGTSGSSATTSALPV